MYLPFPHLSNESKSSAAEIVSVPVRSVIQSEIQDPTSTSNVTISPERRTACQLYALPDIHTIPRHYTKPNIKVGHQCGRERKELSGYNSDNRFSCLAEAATSELPKDKSISGLIDYQMSDSDSGLSESV